MNILGYLQKLGKALMLPIAVLPVAALLLRLGQPDLLDIPFMAEAGNAVFSNLALLFAMGIAVGLAVDGAGAAAIAGAVGFFILKATTATINPDIDMSFFGGIISGIVAGHSYNRFHAVSLPAYLGFFSGKRLVPIMTGLFMLAIGWACGYIWPAIQNGIDAFGHGVAGSGPVGQFVYGTLNRGLIPFGLHHVLNSYFWFGLGDFTNAAGEVVNGDLHRFFAGDPTAGMFMTGFFPVMMFGLPAAALAMYLTAHKSRRAQVGGVLFSVALTAFLTGITEPLEFMFMFLAPGLYAAHAVLTGVSLVVTNAMGVLSGFGFSAGLFDMVLNWGLATNPWTLVIIGLAFAAIYFCVFYFAIKMFNLKTPGREDEDDSAVEVEASMVDKQGMSDNAYQARQFTKAIGGLDNVTNIDACITRLRLTLKDPSVADESVIKALGASGMIRVGEKNLQIILGPQAEIIAGEMKKIAATEDLSTIQLPGQAQEVAATVSHGTVKKEVEVKPLDNALFARQCLKVLGGHQNVTQIDACITRLRLTLKDASSVSDDSIKALGATAVVRVGEKNLQIVVGPQAEMIADEMKKIPVTDDLSNVEVSA
ncbi:N-acetylglucosamine-specific PTS transporter subunit IIBC [Endozoicomonas elysicola]|uniref:N-acetylglucosamine-specific PTS transporter subunit IIBC n=1 Tax=Endozoicomonas elysicola TaxID=305900 RepID=UPI000684E02E|nr:N-acetylglucosamine-specific PTS transporter subunit IIBC [Endozoicomonas elysicola]